jgi:hypothetical protein
MTFHFGNDDNERVDLKASFDVQMVTCLDKPPMPDYLLFLNLFLQTKSIATIFN